MLSEAEQTLLRDQYNSSKRRMTTEQRTFLNQCPTNSAGGRFSEQDPERLKHILWMIMREEFKASNKGKETMKEDTPSIHDTLRVARGLCSVKAVNANVDIEGEDGGGGLGGFTHREMRWLSKRATDFSKSKIAKERNYNFATYCDKRLGAVEEKDEDDKNLITKMKQWSDNEDASHGLQQAFSVFTVPQIELLATLEDLTYRNNPPKDNSPYTSEYHPEVSTEGPEDGTEIKEITFRFALDSSATQSDANANVEASHANAPEEAPSAAEQETESSGVMKKLCCFSNLSLRLRRSSSSSR